MSILITIKSRKLGRKISFCASENPASLGYVRVNQDANCFCDVQIFDRHGNAYTAKDEKQLRAVARRWIASRIAP